MRDRYDAAMQTVPLWVPLATAAVAGGAAIMAALLGGVLKTRGDLGQWRRNMRLESYRTYATVTTEFLHAATRLYGQAPGTAAATTAYDELRVVNRQADVAATLAQMIAPKDVQREVTRTQAAGVAAYNAATSNPRVAANVMTTTANEYIHAQDNFLAEVQDDLGFTGYVRMPNNPTKLKNKLWARSRGWMLLIALLAELGVATYAILSK
jgi:hypothetical protein